MGKCFAGVPEGEFMLDANLADRKVVQYVINRFGIHAKHRLGQNFLVRPDIVAAIALSLIHI